MPMPFVDETTFEQELQYTAADFDLDSSEFQALLTRALGTASEQVASFATEIADGTWQNAASVDDIPRVAREGVIRLARARVARIREDGISKEDLVSGAGYDYRPPQAIRNEVKQQLDEAGYRSAPEDFSYHSTT